SNGSIYIKQQNPISFKYSIFGSDGKLIQSGESNQKKHRIDLPKQTGLYLLKVYNTKNQFILTKSILVK
ncbi:MAG: T9SS type A sorting domain-containing protein, partial [Bacteroidia bacterium]